MTLIMLYTYFTALFSISKSVLVTVNYYGEAAWEPHLILIALVPAVLGWIIYLSEVNIDGD